MDLSRGASVLLKFYLCLLTIISLIAAGCSGSNLTGDGNKATNERKSSSESNAEFTSGDAVEEEDRADEPVMVGGAFLACYKTTLKPTLYGCRVENDYGVKDSSYDYESNYKFSGRMKDSDKKIPVDAEQITDSQVFHWHVTGDSNLTSFEITPEDGAYKSVSILPAEKLSEPISLKAITDGQAQGFIKNTFGQCLLESKGQILMGPCPKSSTNLEITATAIRLKRVKAIDKVTPLAAQETIKAEPAGPYFQFWFSEKRCLAPIIASLADEMPANNRTFSIDTCRTDYTNTTIRNQLFVINKYSATRFQLQNLRFRTNTILSGQEEICLITPEKGSTHILNTETCETIPKDFGFMVYEGLPGVDF